MIVIESLFSTLDSALIMFTFNAAARCFTSASPIMLLQRFRVVSVFDEYQHHIPAAHHGPFPYLVHSQRITYVRRACITDLGARYVQRFSKQQPDAPHRKHPLDCSEDSMRRVSARKVSTKSIQDTMDSALTWFTFNTVARHCAPASLISLYDTSTLVIVCIEYHM